MQALITHYGHPSTHHQQSLSRLLEEIAWLEARLISIGHTGDCAYEKKLARSYQELLIARRKELHEQTTQQQLIHHWS